MPSSNQPRTESRRLHILPLSARHPHALVALAKAYAELLSREGSPPLRDVCYSASIGRAHHNHRLAVVAPTPEVAVEELLAFAEHDRIEQGAVGKVTPGSRAMPVFVFTGMGPQWWGMGAELLEQEPVYRESATAVDEAFQKVAGWSILTEMQSDHDSSRMHETQIAQPANFLLQAALAALLRSVGVEPAAIVGHSVGEVTAAYLSGALDLEDAACVAYHRSRLQQRATRKGRMLAVGLCQSDARALIADRTDVVSVAAVNSHSSVTLAGDEGTLEALAARLQDQGTFNRFLQVEVPYHSPHMDALKAELRESLARLRPQPPSVPLYSTVTGQMVEEATHDAEYWCDNIREPVCFEDATTAILEAGHTTFLEVGPHPVLGAAIKESLHRREVSGRVVACLRREESERATIGRALAELYVSGTDVAWRSLADEGARRVKLPSYPWQRERFWFDESKESRADRLGGLDHPLLGVRLPGPEPAWEVNLSSTALAYLQDHVVEDAVVLPGAAYVEQGVAMGHVLDGVDFAVVEDLEFHRALVVSTERNVRLRSHFDDRTRRFSVFSRDAGDAAEWTRHASGRIAAAPPSSPKRLQLDEIRQRCQDRVDRRHLYELLSEHGLDYGPAFQRIERLWRSSGEVVAQLGVAPPSEAKSGSYHLHPALLDASIQSLVAAVDTDHQHSDPFVPVSIRRMTWFGRTPGSAWSHARLVGQSDRSIEGDIVLCDDDGTVVAELLGVRCQRVPSSRRSFAEWLDDRTYVPVWEQTERPPAPPSSGSWLVLADEGGVGQRLADELTSRGTSGVRVVRRAAIVGANESSGRLDGDSVERLLGDSADLQAVVYLWAMDDGADLSDPMKSRSAVDFLAVVDGLVRREDGETPRLYIVTSGAQAVTPDDPVDGAAQALVIGLGRTALTEHPALRSTAIDVDAEGRRPPVEELADELLADTPETEVALRGSNRFVYRLDRSARRQESASAEGPTTLGATDAGCFRLEVGTPGRLDSVRFRQTRRKPPEAGEVELRIHAAALNFKDVLKATGMLPVRALEGTYHADSLGMEGAGIVCAVGEGVTRYQVGDPVVASVPHSFSSHVTVPAEQLFAVSKLEAMSFSDAASVPVIFMTAYYALHEIARLQKGETVLIHAAAGGVGLAAIQVARWLGATVIATAGNEEKREYLRSLGVEHVLHSRTLEFADEVMALTDGRGVDVVLNSLSGEALLRTLSVVAPLGRFVEIGKRDIVENTPLPLLAFNRNLSFTAFDLDRIMAERPDLIRRLLDDVWERFRAGDFQPTLVEVFPAPQTAEAFRYMAQSKQIGKIVISLEDATGAFVLPSNERLPLLKADASYLVTGGFGGFGLEVAKWMAREGARHLVLVGRGGARSERARETVRELEGMGVEVVAHVADIAQEEQLADCLSRVARQGPPLGGVVHAAAVLDDALLVNLDETRLHRVLAPKARGAWLLHTYLEHQPLDFFVLFSSVASVVGSPGQGSYVAANAYLDALAHHRRAKGLPAVSINWGALGKVGMVAENPAVAEHLARIGITPISPARATAALGVALTAAEPQVGIMEVDWQTWGGFQASTAKLPKFASVIVNGGSGHSAAASELRAMLLAVAPCERPEIAALAVADLIGDTMRMSADKIDIQLPITEMGIDSLMALEIQMAIQSRFGVEVSVLEFQKGAAILGLAETLVSRMGIPVERQPARSSQG